MKPKLSKQKHEIYNYIKLSVITKVNHRNAKYLTKYLIIIIIIVVIS